MANLYSPEQLGIKAPSGGFQQGGWYQGRQYWGGQLSDPGVINPLSDQTGAGQAVSAEVNAQSAAAQGVSASQLESYLQQQRDAQAKANVKPSANVAPQAPSPVRNDSGMDYETGQPVMPSTPQATLNLPDLYKSLYEKEGVSVLEEQLNQKAKAFTDAQSKINDNPFLSEATRTGRISKLTTDYNSSVKNDQDALAMKKQDIATQLELATKQFDIESQQAQQALDQFNTLLNAGALAGASGSDIAAITKATGISSNMIQSAIRYQKDKDIQTSVSTVDDGTNVYSVVINSKTGDVISKQVISASKPSSTGSGGLTNTQYRSTTATALKILNEVDSGYQTLNGKMVDKDSVDYDISPDRMLSSAEADLALQKIVDSVGDASLAEEIFLNAWEQGGYSLWEG